MSVIKTKHWQVEITHDLIDATPIEEPDPLWLYVDPAAHAHRYDKDFAVPTVEWVRTGSYWCDLCHEEHEDGDHRCVQCGAVVRFGTIAVTERRYVAGLVHCQGYVQRGADGFDDLFEWWRDHADEPQAQLPRMDIDQDDRQMALIDLQVVLVEMVGEQAEMIHFVCGRVESV